MIERIGRFVQTVDEEVEKTHQVRQKYLEAMNSTERHRRMSSGNFPAKQQFPFSTAPSSSPPLFLSPSRPSRTSNGAAAAAAAAAASMVIGTPGGHSVQVPTGSPGSLFSFDGAHLNGFTFDDPVHLSAKDLHGDSERELERLRKENLDLKKFLREKEDDTRGLAEKVQIGELTTQVEELGARLKVIELEKATVEGQARELDQKLRTTMGELKQKLLEVEDRTREVEGQRKGEEEVRAKLEEDRAKLEEDGRVLTAELVALRAQFEDKKGELERLEEDKRRTEQESEIARRRAETVEEEKRTLEAETNRIILELQRTAAAHLNQMQVVPLTQDDTSTANGVPGEEPQDHDRQEIPLQGGLIVVVEQDQHALTQELSELRSKRNEADSLRKQLAGATRKSHLRSFLVLALVTLMFLYILLLEW